MEYKEDILVLLSLQREAQWRLDSMLEELLNKGDTSYGLLEAAGQELRALTGAIICMAEAMRNAECGAMRNAECGMLN